MWYDRYIGDAILLDQLSSCWRVTRSVSKQLRRRRHELKPIREPGMKVHNNIWMDNDEVLEEEEEGDEREEQDEQVNKPRTRSGKQAESLTGK